MTDSEFQIGGNKGHTLSEPIRSVNVILCRLNEIHLGSCIAIDPTDLLFLLTAFG